MEVLHTLFNKAPLAALVLALANGFWVGKVRFGKFQLVGMAERYWRHRRQIQGGDIHEDGCLLPERGSDCFVC